MEKNGIEWHLVAHVNTHNIDLETAKDIGRQLSKKYNLGVAIYRAGRRDFSLVVGRNNPTDKSGFLCELYCCVAPHLGEKTGGNDEETNSSDCIDTVGDGGDGSYKGEMETNQTKDAYRHKKLLCPRSPSCGEIPDVE